MVAVTFGGPPLTRMPSQTFNLGHEAARESDHRFSALRNCGKDRREQNVQKKKERGRERERENTNRKIFNHSISFSFFQISLYAQFPPSRRNESKLKLGPNYLDRCLTFQLSRYVDTKYRSTVPTWSLSRPFKFPRNPYRIVQWSIEDSPCSPRRWTRQSGSLPRVRRTPCTVDSSATQKIILFPEFVPLKIEKEIRTRSFPSRRKEGLAILGDYLASVTVNDETKRGKQNRCPRSRNSPIFQTFDKITMRVLSCGHNRSHDWEREEARCVIRRF